VLALLRCRAGGLTRTEIRREAFGINRPAEAINRILAALVESGAVVVPEPSSFGLAVLGGLGLAGAFGRRRSG